MLSNEQLAESIKAGNESLLPELWKQCEKFITKQAAQYLQDWKRRPDYDIEDLIQSGYFALVKAVKKHDPERGSFLTYLNFFLLTEFAKVAGCYSSKQEPLNTAKSLFEPLQGLDDSGDDVLLLDTIQATESGFEAVEDAMYQEYVSNTVREAVASLPEKQRRTIEEHFFNGKSFEEISLQLHVSNSRAAQISKDGLRALRNSSKAPELSVIYCGRNLYKGTGFHSWKNSGYSHPEREVERAENRRAKLQWLMDRYGISLEEASQIIS